MLEKAQDEVAGPLTRALIRHASGLWGLSAKEPHGRVGCGANWLLVDMGKMRGTSE